MSRWERDLSDPFLDEVEDAEALVNGAAPAAAAPDAALRAALLGAARLEGRFARFAEMTARLLDVDEERARATLERIDDPSAWYTSALDFMDLVDLTGGPKVAQAITGFARIQPGAVFPEHEHHGEENIFVIQGSMEDSEGRVFRAGELATMPEGSSHHFSVRAGPDLVYLLVVQNGISIAGQRYNYDDPRV